MQNYAQIFSQWDLHTFGYDYKWPLIDMDVPHYKKAFFDYLPNVQTVCETTRYDYQRKGLREL